MSRVADWKRAARERWWPECCRIARARDLRVLMVPLLVIVGLWGFAEVADEVTDGETQQLDEWVLEVVRTEAEVRGNVGAVLSNAARDITALGSTTVLTLLVIAVLGFLVLRRLWHAALLVLGATVGGALLSQALKGAFQRERPAIVPHLDHVITYSFPSGHSLVSAVVYLTLGSLLARIVEGRRLKLYCLGIAGLATILVGVSRVFLGVHYPSDVVAGWAAGLAWASLCWLVARALQRRGQVEAPADIAAEEAQTGGTPTLATQ